MDSMKRCADDALSSDDDGPAFPLRKVMRHETRSPASNNACVVPSQQSFDDFLADHVPISLVDTALQDYLVLQSNKRLDRAREEDINIIDITIGDECLPTWPSLYWDPSVEPLHSAMQRRLDDLEAAQKLGPVVRDEVIVKGNRRLEEAKKLGVSLQKIYIGTGLLPEWEDDVVLESADDSEEGFDSQKLLDNGDVSPSLSSDGTSPEEPLNSDAWDFVLQSVGYDTSSSDIESSESITSSELDDVTPEHDIFYQISMNNLVDDRAYYSDDPNTFFDAELVGGALGYSSIDFDFYAATEEDDAEDLPELEFAVDRHAFEYYFETEDAIDVEVPGVHLRCTGEIEAVIEVDDDGNELEEEEDNPLRFIRAPALSSAGLEQPSSTGCSNLPRDNQADATEVQADTDSDVSEEVTDDEVDRHIF